MVKKPTKTAMKKQGSTMFTSSRKKPDPVTETAPDPVTETAPETSPTIDAGMAALSGVSYDDFADDEPDEDAPKVIGAEPEPEVLPDPEEMTKDAFWQMFKTAFKVASVLPFVGIPELAIAPDEVEHGRVASDAIYDLLKMYVPSFFKRDSEVIALVFAAGSFLIMKAMIVSAVIKARQAQAIADQNAQRQQRNNPQPAPQAQTAAPQGQAPAGYEASPIVEWAA
jgi:hypothetical protein